LPHSRIPVQFFLLVISLRETTGFAGGLPEFGRSGKKLKPPHVNRSNLSGSQTQATGSAGGY